MTYGFIDNALNHCAKLLGNDMGKEKYLILLYISIGNMSQYEGVQYQLK